MSVRFRVQVRITLSKSDSNSKSKSESLSNKPLRPPQMEPNSESKNDDEERLIS
jgi:hypothetical protein